MTVKSSKNLMISYCFLICKEVYKRFTSFVPATRVTGLVRQKRYPSYYARHRDTHCTAHEHLFYFVRCYITICPARDLPHHPWHHEKSTTALYKHVVHAAAH